jgi:aryl-phospho-beta-D-glucosidase BglC (GH1 family)
VAWFCHSDTVNSIIDSAWIARVKEVVDYCINDDFYVIINAHWDKGWLENRVNEANQAIVNQRQQAYWTQIANYFRDYDERLLFAGANEPNVHDAASMAVLMTYHQTFIDAVRATGGNNSSRTLIVQGPSTDIETTTIDGHLTNRSNR